jgi:hypothetical protein
MGVSFAARLGGGIVLIAASIGAMLALAGIHTPARGPLVLTFLAVAPACAAAWSLRRLDPLARLMTAAAAAVVVNALVAEGLLISHQWSPRLGVAAAATVSAVWALAAPRAVRVT